MEYGTNTAAGAATGSRAESVTDLLKELRDETTLLMRQEVALAKTEMSEKVGRIGRNVAFAIAGALIAFLGLIFVLQAAVVGVGILLAIAGLQEHALWLAPLIVGVVIAIIGAVLIKKGIAGVKRESLVPEKTLNSLKEDKEWIRNKAH